MDNELEGVLLASNGGAEKSENERRRILAAFKEMYRDVFAPLRTHSTSSGNADSTIAEFRAVFRKHFRSNDISYLSDEDLKKVSQQAEIAFEKAVKARRTRCSGQKSLEDVKQLEEVLQVQVQMEKKWIQTVNKCRRKNFLKAVTCDVVDKFRRQLEEKCFLENGEFYEESEIRQVSEALMGQIEVEFICEEIPSFEGASQVEEWCTQLRPKMSEVVTSLLQRNDMHRQILIRKIKAGVEQYKDMMSKYFEDNPYKREELSRYQSQVEKKCMEDNGLELAYSDPLLKERCGWDAKITDEFERLRTKWRDMCQYKIEVATEALKKDFQNRFRKHLSLPLEDADLDRMFWKFDENVWRWMEKAGSISDIRTATTSVEQGTTKTRNERNKRSTLAPIVVTWSTNSVVVFPANTELPSNMKCSSVILSNDQGHSGCIVVTIFEGVSPRKKLAEIKVDGIPATKEGEIITLRFRAKVDIHGRLVGTIKAKPSGNPVAFDVKTSAWWGNDFEGGSMEKDHTCGNKRSGDSEQGECSTIKIPNLSGV